MFDEIRAASNLMMNQIEVQAGQIEHLMSGIFNPIESRFHLAAKVTDRQPISPDDFATDAWYEMEESAEQEEQLQSKDEVSFAVDDDGYLMDREGNFILDDRGDMVRLSKTELNTFVA